MQICGEINGSPWTWTGYGCSDRENTVVGVDYKGQWREEASWVEFLSFQWNTEEMNVVRYNGFSMADLSREA